jgi:CxC1 like cysteine cluster associated with KDZ transposases
MQSDTKVLDISFCDKHPIHRALVRAGYFPSSPEVPKKAFHVNVLKFYRHLHVFGVSHQAWCGALANMHEKGQSMVSEIVIIFRDNKVYLIFLQ